jgi:hypothetical protein
MNLAFTYSWLLPAGDLAHVRDIIEQLRQHAIELGSESVSDVIVLTGDDAQAVQPKARHAVLFTATVPGATEGKYGLAAAGNSSWSWSGAVVISSARTVSELHTAAADLGIEVVEVYSGMIFTSRKNAAGAVVTEQRQAFDWTDF